MAETLQKIDRKPKTQRRKDERPQEIVAAAFEVFAEKGFAAARLDDVARRAGVAKGTIYLYFDSKEELFKAVVRKTVIPSFEESEQLVEHFEGPTEELLRMVLTRMTREFVETDIHHIIRLIHAEGRQFPDLAEFYFQEVISRGMARMRKILKRGVERGEFRDVGLDEFPQMVVAPAIMSTVWKSTFEPFLPMDLEAAMNVQLDVYLNGLKANPDKANPDKADPDKANSDKGNPPA